LRALYFTHCCAKKDNSLKNTDKKVPPAQLYQATPTQRFVRNCQQVGVEWAIFSDKYGFVFPNDRIQWYERHPSTVTPSEKEKLFNDANSLLQRYDLAYFYYNPGRIHPFYLELVREMRRRGRAVREITHLGDVET